MLATPPPWSSILNWNKEVSVTSGNQGTPAPYHVGSRDVKTRGDKISKHGCIYRDFQSCFSWIALAYSYIEFIFPRLFHRQNIMVNWIQSIRHKTHALHRWRHLKYIFINHTRKFLILLGIISLYQFAHTKTALLLCYAQNLISIM